MFALTLFSFTLGAVGPVGTSPLPPTTTKPATTTKPTTCLAEELVKDALNMVDEVLDYAKKGLLVAEGSRFIGKEAKALYNDVVMAELALDLEAPLVEMQICTRCEDMAAVFGRAKNRIEGKVDKLGNAALEKVVDGVLNMIDDAFVMVCPGKTHLMAAKGQCIIGAFAAVAVDDVNTALQWAEHTLLDNPLGKHGAPGVEKVIKEIVEKLSVVAAKMAVAPCVLCRDIVKVFDNVNEKIVKAIEKGQKNPKVIKTIQKVVTVVDAKFKELCVHTPSNSTTTSPTTTTA